MLTAAAGAAGFGWHPGGGRRRLYPGWPGNAGSDRAFPSCGAGPVRVRFVCDGYPVLDLHEDMRELLSAGRPLIRDGSLYKTCRRRGSIPLSADCRCGLGESGTSARYFVFERGEQDVAGALRTPSASVSRTVSEWPSPHVLALNVTTGIRSRSTGTPSDSRG